MLGPERTPHAGFRLQVGLALLLAAAAGLITIDAGFVFDDHQAIVHNPVVGGQVGAAEAFARDFWGQPLAAGKIASYRPLMTLVWRGLWAVAPQPLAFHLLSLLLHVAAVAAFVFAGLRLGVERRLLGAAAMIFAVHATHAEAVGANVSHADLLSAGLGLLVLGFAASARGLGAGLGLAALSLVACFVKESAFVFAGAALVVIALRPAPVAERARTLAPLALAMLGVLALQLSFDRINDPRYSQSLAYDAHGLDRLLLGLAFYGRGAVISFLPHGLSPKHSYAAWDLSAETLLPHAIPGALLLLLSLLALAMAFRQRRADLAALLVLLIGPLLINSGLIVPMPNELPERTLYPALMAASVLIALLVQRLASGWRAQALLALVVLAMFAQRYPAQRAWHDEPALYRYALGVEPKSAELNMFVAQLDEQAGRTDSAIWRATVTAYIASQRPARVDFEPVEQLAQLPLPERWLRAPAVLDPAQPCRFARGMLLVLRGQLPALESPAFAGWRVRYPRCFPAPD